MSYKLNPHFNSQYLPSYLNKDKLNLSPTRSILILFVISRMDAIKKECKRSNDSTAKVLVRSPSPKIQTQKARNLDKSRAKELQLPKKCKILSQALTTGSNQWQHLTAAMSAKMNQQLPLHQSQYQKKLKWRVVEPIRNPRQTSTSISTNNPINRNQISQPNPSTLMTY